MEFRRLIGFGKSSFVVSLPKNWIERNKLVKGDLIYLKERDQELILTSQEKEAVKELRKVSITTDAKEIDLLRAEIIAAYLANFDLIEIKGNDLKSKAPEIKSILHDLAGVELLEQSSDRILTKDLLDLKEISIDSLIRRVDIIVRSMIEDSTAAPHEDFYESISHRDVDVNRLVLLTKRVLRSAMMDYQIARSLSIDTIGLLKSWQMINALELAADEVKRISRSFKEVELNKQNKEELEKTNVMMREAYLKVMKAYHTKDIRLAYTIEVETNKRMRLLQTMLKKNNDNSVMRLIFHLRCFNGVLRDIGRIITS